MAAKPETGRPGAKPVPRSRSATTTATAADADSKPVLLSSGNPQIAKGVGEAPVQAYIAAMPGWKSGIGQQIDALVTRLVPGVQKAVKWNTPLYGLDGASWFLGYYCMTRYVKVSFFRGSDLSPLPPVASKQAHLRSAHIHEGEGVDEALIAGWIEQASRLPGQTL